MLEFEDCFLQFEMKIVNGDIASESDHDCGDAFVVYREHECGDCEVLDRQLVDELQETNNLVDDGNGKYLPLEVKVKNLEKILKVT